MAKKKETSLVLRNCGPNGESQNGFRWPLTVGEEAVCPDWAPTEECGNGLHGWLYGSGDHGVANFGPDKKWLVVEVESTSIIMLGGKCKFPRGVVRFVGSMAEAAKFIRDNEPKCNECLIIGETVVADVLASTGAYGTSTSGDSGTSTSGYRGTSTSGAYGTSTSGDRGTSTSGAYGTSTSGDSGTSRAGEKGEIRIRWWDKKNDRYRTVIGYVGEDGIEANTAYRLNDKHKFVKA